jgi:hypothetical protein
LIFYFLIFYSLILSSIFIMNIDMSTCKRKLSRGARRRRNKRMRWEQENEASCEPNILAEVPMDQENETLCEPNILSEVPMDLNIVFNPQKV